MTADETLKELERFAPEQNVTLYFTLAAGEVTDGDSEKMLHDNSVSVHDLAAIKRLKHHVPVSLSRHPDIALDSDDPAGRAVFSATASRKIWEEVLSSAAYPARMLPDFGKTVEVMRASAMRDHTTNPFRQSHVRISLSPGM